MKSSGIFNLAKELVYFLVENRHMCSPFQCFCLRPGLKVRNGKDFLFKKREVEKLFDYFSPL